MYKRQGQDIPKQFMHVDGVPIIIRTMQCFQQHPDVSAIAVVCLNGWETVLQSYANQFMIDKLKWIFPGGNTGMESIHNGVYGLKEMGCNDEDLVLIHDGVRPLIDSETISNNIASVKKYGTAITCTVAKETVILVDKDNNVSEVPSREQSRFAKAPQSFWLKEILDVERQAINEGKTDMIDSCTLMRHYGKKLNVVVGPNENIKITTPDDFYIFRALYDARENQQLE